MQRGWKQRQSVKDVDRSKWDGRNNLSDIVEKHYFRNYQISLKYHSGIEQQLTESQI